MKVLDNLKYTKDHEWIKIEGNIGYIGITDYAQSELGDIAYVDIPDDVTEIKCGEPFGTIEAVKAVSDLNAPVSGKVIEINSSINDDPAVINTDPYEKGWLIKIEISSPNEINELLDAAQYTDFIK